MKIEICIKVLISVGALGLIWWGSFNMYPPASYLIVGLLLWRELPRPRK